MSIILSATHRHDHLARLSMGSLRLSTAKCRGQSAKNRGAFPVDTRRGIRPGNRIRDLPDAAELLDVNGRKADWDSGLRFVLLDEEEELLIGEQGSKPLEGQGEECVAKRAKMRGKSRKF